MASISLSMYSMNSIYVSNNKTHSPTSYTQAHFHVCKSVQKQWKDTHQADNSGMAGRRGRGIFVLSEKCMCV